MPIILLLLIQSILFASPAFVSIPEGTFQMGSEEGNRDESPVRRVEVRAFEMESTEVTVSEYLRCMADGVCSTPTWWTQGYFESTSDTLTPSQQMQLPITGVSWAQAMEYCAWLGPIYRLPTEAEWEFAAGGFKGYSYPWGMNAEGYKVFQTNRLNPVGSKPASVLGLHDMEGSVWEWVYDCYDALEPDGSCKRHVTKGGSWSEHIWNLRIANKSYGLTSQGYKTLGFRVVRHAR